MSRVGAIAERGRWVNEKEVKNAKELSGGRLKIYFESCLTGSRRPFYESVRKFLENSSIQQRAFMYIVMR